MANTGFCEKRLPEDVSFESPGENRCLGVYVCVKIHLSSVSNAL